ncbi:MAG TPA: PGPGW domain-containing protein [Candidatus Saccharimonadales bacterium]|nr:PGPGW domain-containing protein [Candidatus Saccharimonadales bacterium]
MDFMRRNLKRILTDAAGYALIVAAILTGWLPGPGGIPLAIAGLGLLSINNEWARRIREWLVAHAGKLGDILFPKNSLVEWAYDLLAALLLALTFVLELRHASVIEMTLGVSAFFIALLIALSNRDRLKRLRGKHKR